MTRAIEEDPPLPDEDLSGWEGLGTPELDLGEPAHEHHHDHDGEHDQDHGSEPDEDPHENGSHATSAEEHHAVD